MRLALSCVAMLALASPALAQEIPGSGALPLSQILGKVEAGGTRIVYSADWERKGWEVVSCPGRTRDCVEELIDAANGSVVESERESVGTLPPEGALRASEIAAKVEALNLGRITEMEFDDRRWEVEVREGRRRAEFKLDPATGEVRRCEGSLCP